MILYSFCRSVQGIGMEVARMETPFILGVNYWPRRKAMGWWKDFDAGEVHGEFATIAGLGMTVVRIFLLWEDFQPTPDSVDAASLANLHTVADIAAHHKLVLDVTFFTGHMSGPNWCPGWLLGEPADPTNFHHLQVVSANKIVDKPYRNPYHDPIALAAERLLLTTVVTGLKDHPGIGWWNLGNEPDLFAWPRDAAAGQAWVREMTQLIKAIDPVHPVTCGLHADSLFRTNNLRVHEVYAETDWAVMHSYPMYVSWMKNPLDPDYVPFTCAVVSALCGKPTLMEEFGGCTAPPGAPSQVWNWTAYGKPRAQFMASEEDLAAYYAAVLPTLVDVGATGAMLWCFADYSSDLWNEPPCDEARHERFFGMVRPDGTLKPHAEVIKQFAASKPTVKTAVRPVQLGVSAADFYTDPSGHMKRLFAAFAGTDRLK